MEKDVKYVVDISQAKNVDVFVLGGFPKFYGRELDFPFYPYNPQ